MTAEQLTARGVAHFRANEMREAIACFKRAQAINPDYAQAHLYEGMARLTLGQYLTGWRKYEYRMQVTPVQFRSKIDVPVWRGENIKDLRLLLIQDQGAGDASSSFATSRCF